MLQKPNVNVSNIMRVIESIKSDPEFNMATWPHCICGHCHRVMGDTRYEDYFGAYDFLGIDPHLDGNRRLFGNDDGRDKAWAIQTLEDLIAFDGVTSSSFDAVPSSVE